MLNGLTENHARSLLASIQHAARLIRDGEEVLSAAEHPQVLSRYTSALTPPQQKIARDYLGRLRQQLLRFLDGVGLPPPDPSVDAVLALSTTMIFLDDAFEEMRGSHLRGYGEVPPAADRVLDGLVSELQALVREAGTFFTGAPAAVLRERVRRLPDDHPVKGDLEELSRIITDHGLVDLRPLLGLILDRAVEDTFEVAVVGRVSSGKSTLLNALIGAAILPAGVLPVTAFPTRLRRGPVPLLRVTGADGRVTTAEADHIDEFVTETKNPGNEKRLARLIVEFPSERVPEGVTFVDTPGLGSLASSGALQTFAYLPRCDHATFLLDATAPVSEEDLNLLAFLRDAEITTSVLLSKADLLAPSDLAQVRAYVSRQVGARVGADVSVRAISSAPGFRPLLEAWIDEEVRPLGHRARARAHEAVLQKVDRLRRQTLAALEHKQTPPREGQAANASEVTRRLRDVAAALEQTRRDLSAIGDQRASVVQASVAAAVDVMVSALREPAAPADDRVRGALARPAQEVAERVARHLVDRAAEVRDALSAVTRETGMAESPEDSDPIDRGVPLLDLPPVEMDLSEPVWTRASRGVLRVWVRRRAQAELEPSLDRAVAAYLAVLKRWANDALTRIRHDFESQSRPLLSRVSEPGGSGRISDLAALERDLAWLRREPPQAPGAEPRAVSSAAAGHSK